MRNLVNYKLIFLVSIFIISLGYDDAYSQDNTLQSLQIGNRIIQVEFANNGEKVRRGLTGRAYLPEDQGMLLMIPSEGFLFLGMRHTYIPLSVGFFNAEKELVEIQDMHPDILVVSPIRSLNISSDLVVHVVNEGLLEVDTLVITPTRRLYVSSYPCQYALEANQGWFERNGIEIGTQFEFK